jgi:hypothetical protein
MDIVKTALEYYDKNNERFEKIFQKIKFIKLFKNDADIEHTIYEFYDKDKKKLFKSRIEFAGKYIPKSKIWLWAWATPLFIKNTTYLSRKILNYGLDIIPTENLSLKTELITSRSYISDKIQLDIHVAISSYLTKIPSILKLNLPAEIPEDMQFYEVNKDKNDKDYSTMYIFILDYDKINK